MKFTSTLFGLIFLLSLTACAPKIFVIDNQTILEEDAAGSWPQFDKEVIEKSKRKGPASISQVPENARRARLYQVLNGEPGLSLAGQKK